MRLSNDTMVAAYLIDPARRRYPLDELLDEAGIEPVVEGGDDAARAAVGVRALSADQQEEIDRLELRGLLEDIELPLVDVLYRLELQGVKLDTYRLGETAARVSEEIDELEHQIYELAGEEFTIGSPQQLVPRSCSRSWSCRASAAARPASPPTPACCARSARSTRSSRRSSGGAS